MSEVKKYLNRDGLEEYNSLLPHSSGEMQDYVADWLDAHPEATTTVQDGAISEPKLADNSVSLRTLADDTVHMLKGMMITREISGEILTANDAYSAPPVALTVEGKSTQDRTPTPDAPVEINSIEQIRFWFSGKNLCKLPVLSTWTTENGVPTINEMKRYEIYVGAPNIPFTVSVTFAKRLSGTSSAKIYITTFDGREKSILLNGAQGRYSKTGSSNQNGIIAMAVDWHYVVDAEFGPNVINIQLEIGSTATAYEPYDDTNVLLNLTHALRSLPDGTHDELSFSYMRPSTREGWAWYERVMERGVGIVTVSAFTSYDGRTRHGSNPGCVFGIAIDAPAVNVLGYCSHGVWVKGTTATENYGQFGSAWVTHNDPNLLKFTIAPDRSSLALGNEWLTENGPITFVYKLATPATTTLDPIELPVLPAPDVTVWSDPSTGLKMQYIRDTNLVIQRIEEAIADQ